MKTLWRKNQENSSDRISHAWAPLNMTKRKGLRTRKVDVQCMVHGLINYIDIKAKCRHLKNFTCKGTLLQVFIYQRPPPLL